MVGRWGVAFIASVTMAASLTTAAPVWSRGANTEYAYSVDGRLRVVNRSQQFVVLYDGTVFYAERPDQLDQLVPGDAVHVQFVSTAGRKRIEQIQKIAR